MLCCVVFIVIMYEVWIYFDSFVFVFKLLSCYLSENVARSR